MNFLLEAAAEIADFLEREDVPYAILGGLAVQYWGEPRTTRDVDIVAMVQPQYLGKFLEKAVNRFTPRIKNAITFAKKSRVLLLKATNDCPIDLSLGIPGYEESVIQRAIIVCFPNVRPLRLISAEDLIIHKCVAGRPRDLEDVECILIRQKGKVNVRYIKRWLKEFAPLVNEYDIILNFENILKKVRKFLYKSGC